MLIYMLIEWEEWERRDEWTYIGVVGIDSE